MSSDWSFSTHSAAHPQPSLSSEIFIPGWARVPGGQSSHARIDVDDEEVEDAASSAELAKLRRDYTRLVKYVAKLDQVVAELREHGDVTTEPIDPRLEWAQAHREQFEPFRGGFAAVHLPNGLVAAGLSKQLFAAALTNVPEDQRRDLLMLAVDSLFEV